MKTECIVVAKASHARIVLVASDPFPGLVRSHQSGQTRKLLLRTVASDFTTLREDDLAARLAARAQRP